MVNRKPEDRVCPFLSLLGDEMTYCIGDRCALFREPVFDEEPDISFEPQAVGEEAEERDFPAEKIKDPFEVKDISKRKRSEKIAGKGKAGGKGGRNR